MSVLVDRHGPVTVVTIDRPEAGNSLNRTVLERVGRAFRDADADPGVGAVVLTGAGDRIFCAGLDLKAFANDEQPMERHEDGSEAHDDDVGFEVFRRRYAKPVIAAVNGHAVAGGFELLLRCDLVVAAEHAEFGLPEVKRGLVAGAGVTVLPRRIPMAVLLELALVGARIPATRAYELGLVNRIVPRGEALAGALDLAALVAENGPLAVRLTKELAYGEEDDLAPRASDRVGRAVATAVGSDDAKEGARAFVEKRAPRWTGT